ncbi:MAG TPA: RsiV family protein [Acidimicrobiales bacterium]|nr:RsiV family protein [Acidimicrobiales bacterium]
MSRLVTRTVLVASLLGLVSCANYDGRSMKGENPTDTLDVLVNNDQESEGQEDGFSKFSTTQLDDPLSLLDGEKGEPNLDLDPFQGVGGDSVINLETLSGTIGEVGSYELTFPQVSETASDFAINGAIQSVADRIYLDFATEIADISNEGTVIGVSDLVGEGRIVFNNGYLLSVLFEGSTDWGGAASQQSWTESVMLDLSNGQILTAEDLFQLEISTDWKEVIADRSYGLLAERLGSEMIWDEGLLPIAENFNNMLVTQSGLLVVFDQYQVAAGVAGTPTVIIPWVEIAAIINPQSRIGELVIAGGSLEVN